MRRRLPIVPLLIAATAVFAACDGQSMNVRLVNDTDETLDFLQCREDLLDFGAKQCDGVGGRSGRDRPPGESYTALISVGTPTWYRLEDESGTTIGCLRMEFDHYEKGAEAFASQAQACPD